MRHWLAVAVVASIILACGLEELENHYVSVPVARASGAFSRGWLPDVLPEDARDIWERHNLDTNVTWGCFATPSGFTVVRDKLDRLHAKRMPGPVDAGPGKAWWPASMTLPEVEVYELKEQLGLSVVVGLARDGDTVCFHRRSGG